MIDIHTHLLPGVDDGSPSVDVSLTVLDAFHEAGVGTVVCTPHLNASQASSAPFEKHKEILANLKAHLRNDVQLQSGWEIMLDEPNVELTDPRLTLAGSSAVLVEFPRTAVPPNATAELFRIRTSGMVPVLAHPERYRGCTVADVAEWKRAGAVMQMDVAAVIGAQRIGQFAREMLAHGLIDIFASDTHGDGRSIGPAKEWLADHATPEHLDLLTETNARLLLSDRELLPVPPLRLNERLIDRLRSLFRRSRRSRKR
jgi:protein-tyrosine phosphatase